MVITEALPRHCTFNESTRRILAAFWYPVAFSNDILDQPYAAGLLAEIQAEIQAMPPPRP